MIEDIELEIDHNGELNGEYYKEWYQRKSIILEVEASYILIYIEKNASHIIRKSTCNDTHCKMPIFHVEWILLNGYLLLRKDKDFSYIQYNIWQAMVQ